MKILFTRFPLESAYGGAEVQTLSLMEGLMERGHAVAFAGSCPVLLEECRKRNIPHAEWRIGPPPVTKTGALSFAWRKRSMKRKLSALLDRFKDIDAIAMLSLSEKLLLTDIAAARGKKVVWIEHDTVGRWLTKNPWLPLLIEKSGKATTVGVSEMSRKLYVDMGWDEKKTVAIPNGVVGSGEWGDRANQNPISLSPRPPLRLLCVARLSPEKGVDVLLDAIANLPDVTLDIVGDGTSERDLKTHAKTLGDRVRFLGRRDDVRALYKEYDVLALPSREHDPFGLVAAEAMMAGIPAVVTDACGIASYLTNGKDALIAKAGDRKSLAKAIDTLRESKKRLELAEEAKKTFDREFKLERMIDKYEELFKI